MEHSITSATASAWECFTLWHYNFARIHKTLRVTPATALWWAFIGTILMAAMSWGVVASVYSQAFLRGRPRWYGAALMRQILAGTSSDGPRPLR
jgi:hypothetical protein